MIARTESLVACSTETPVAATIAAPFAYCAARVSHALPSAWIESAFSFAAFFCSPSNPEGACATASDWRRLFDLADRYDFVVLADECYCEIYDGAPPVGALEVLFTLREEFAQWLEEAQSEDRREELQNVYRHVAAMEEEYERRRARAANKLKTG